MIKEKKDTFFSIHIAKVLQGKVIAWVDLPKDKTVIDGYGSSRQ